MLGKLDVIATHFENKEPDGWVSRLAQALPGMSDKLGDIAPFGLLINHYLDHSQASDALKAQVKCFWQEYLTFLDERHLQLAHAEYPYKGLTQFPHYALTQFLDAMQIAMFFARGGRD